MIRDMKSRKARPARPRIPRTAGETTAARAHVAALKGIPQALARFGIPSESILAVVNLRASDLDDPERSAPFGDLDRLLGLCLRRTRCGHFGLLVGQDITLQSFGVAGRVARNAPSVGAALQDLAAYFLLHDSGGSVRVAIHDGRVTLGYGIHVPGMKHSDQVYDLAVAALANVMRQLCGSDWRPDAVLLPRKRPADIRPYREHFAAPLRFNSIMAAVVFPERQLSQAIADADPAAAARSRLDAAADPAGRWSGTLSAGFRNSEIEIDLPSADGAQGRMSIRALGVEGAPFEVLDFIPGPIWLFLKICVMVFIYMWVRWTIIRYRYNQLMSIGWKVRRVLKFFSIKSY